MTTKCQLWNSVLMVTLLRGKSLLAMDDNGKGSASDDTITHIMLQVSVIPTASSSLGHKNTRARFVCCDVNVSTS